MPQTHCCGNSLRSWGSHITLNQECTRNKRGKEKSKKKDAKVEQVRTTQERHAGTPIKKEGKPPAGKIPRKKKKSSKLTYPTTKGNHAKRKTIRNKRRCVNQQGGADRGQGSPVKKKKVCWSSPIYTKTGANCTKKKKKEKTVEHYQGCNQQTEKKKKKTKTEINRVRVTKNRISQRGGKAVGLDVKARTSPSGNLPDCTKVTRIYQQQRSRGTQFQSKKRAPKRGE